MQFPSPIISSLISETKINFKVEKPVVALVLLIFAALAGGSFLLITMMNDIGDVFDWIGPNSDAPIATQFISSKERRMGSALNVTKFRPVIEKFSNQGRRRGHSLQSCMPMRDLRFDPLELKRPAHLSKPALT